MLPLFAGVSLVGLVLFGAIALVLQLAVIALAAWVVKWVWRRPAGDELARLRALVLAMYDQISIGDRSRLAPVEYAAVRQDLVKEL